MQSQVGPVTAKSDSTQNGLPGGAFLVVQGGAFLVVQGGPFCQGGSIFTKGGSVFAICAAWGSVFGRGANFS